MVGSRPGRPRSCRAPLRATVGVSRRVERRASACAAGRVPRQLTHPPPGPARSEGTGPPKAEPRPDDRPVAVNKPPAAGIGTVAIQLCRTFSTSGGSWRCDPIGSSAAPGPLVLYTRIRSPRDTVVVHRWYRGDTLRQSVSLTIRANATEGFRTYSRQTVTNGDWRVEVRSADGNVLHEQRFAVR